MSEPPLPDVEDERIDALLEAHARGQASDAERVELELYVAQRPELAARVEQAARHGELGEGWLARVEADHQIERAEQAPRARIERAAGASIAVVGTVLSFVAPVVGAPLVGVGSLVLLYSFIRVRLRTHATDPYKDVIR